MRSLPLLSVVLLTAIPGLAQQSTNDLCANARVVTPSPTNTPVEWMLADMEHPASAITPAACTSQGFLDVWFKFTATAASHWVVYDAPVQGYWVVEAFSGICGTLTSLACDGGNDHMALTGLSVGTTYYFRTYANNTLNFPTDYRHVAVVSAPPHDDCPGAIALPIEDPADQLFPLRTGSTVGATAGPVSCSQFVSDQGDSDDDVWFSFTATGTAHAVLLSPSADLSLEVFSGACGGLTEIRCAHDAADQMLLQNLAVGQTYRMRVYTSVTDATVRQRFRIGVFAMAANDECAGALPVEVAAADDAPIPIAAPLAASSTSAQPTGCTATTYDLWYSFTAPSSSVYFLDDGGSGNLFFSLYDGSCGSLSCIIEHVSTQALASSLVPGNTYYLSVGMNSNQRNRGFHIRELPANDECGGAITVPVQSGNIPSEWTYCDSHYATQSMPGCQNATYSDDDLWYEFTATNTTHVLHILDESNSVGEQVELFSGTCANLTSVHCSAGNAATTVLDSLTVGSTYLLRVYKNNVGARLVARLAITAQTANAECSGAIAMSTMDLSDFATTSEVMPVAGAEPPFSCGSNLNHDLWYTFTATGTSAALVAHPTLPLPLFAAELFSGGCGSLTSIDCRSGLEQGRFRINYQDLTPGTQYHLRVGSQGGAHQFTPLFFAPPPNDEITGAVELPANASPFANPVVQHWTYGASQSYGLFCGTQGTPDDDVWFRFIATQAAHTISATRDNVQFREDFPASSMRIEAFTGFSTDSATLYANALSCAVNTLPLTGLTVGDTIYFRVFSDLGTFQSIYAFRPYVTGGNNDEATGALQMGFSNDWSATFDTDGATQSQAGANCSVADFADDDIWFRFTATNEPGRIIAGYADKDLALELFSGIPGNLTPIACSGNILALPSSLVAGQTYYFRLYSWNNNAPVAGRIGLWTDPSLTANSCVDELCLGPVLLDNPGFEQGDLCNPIVLEQGASTFGLTLAPGWWYGGEGTADSYSSCAGFGSNEEVPASGLGTSTSRPIVSRRGTGMAGLFMFFGTNEYAEYVQAELTQPLIPGEPYLVSFNVASYREEGMGDAFGALLTKGAVAQGGTSQLDLTPQVISSTPVGGEVWTTVCGIVVPNEPLDHITIGSFRKSAESATMNLSTFAYFYIDDVVVARVNDPDCITTAVEDLPQDDAANTNTNDGLHVYPNPAKDRLNIVADAGILGKRGVIEVFDVTGKRVYAEQVSNFGAVQPLDLSGEWKEGLYLLLVRVEGQAPRSARVVVEQ